MLLSNDSAGPVAMAYGMAPPSGVEANYGYAPGVSLIDFVPDHFKERIHPHWAQYPPVNPMWHYLLGGIYCILCAINFGGNLAVVYLYSKASYLKTPANLLVVNLAISDFWMMMTNGPPYIHNCFWGGYWMFSNFACDLYAATGAVTGVCSIWTLAFISFDRYNIICNGFNGPKMSQGKAMMMILFAWLYGTAVSLPPFFGWSRYMGEGILDACSFDYVSQNWEARSHCLFMFSMCFCLPLSTIIFSYICIVKHISAHESAMRAQAAKMNVKSLRSAEANEQRAEIRIAKVAIANTALWIVCWCPYAITILQGTLGDLDRLTPLATMLPSLLAKTASCYNPFVYALSHPKFRLAITQHMKWFCVHQEEAKTDDSQSTATSKD